MRFDPFREFDRMAQETVPAFPYADGQRIDGAMFLSSTSICRVWIPTPST